MKPSTAFASNLVALGIATVVLAGPADAQEVTYLPEDATYCDMFRGLSKVIPGECAEPGDRAMVPDTGLPPGIKTRGIRLQDEKPTITAAPPGSVDTASSTVPATMTDAVEQTAPPEALSIAIRVQFAYNSAQLTPQAMGKLDDVANVLNDPLMAQKVVEIEGHADAYGPDGYNLTLSERRAQMVRNYLIEQHGVAADRLPYIGRGETEPFDPDPYAAINRRVEFHNITG